MDEDKVMIKSEKDKVMIDSDGNRHHYVKTIKTKRGNYIDIYKPTTEPTQEEVDNFYKSFAEILVRDYKTRKRKI